jgi:hypothetical protein
MIPKLIEGAPTFDDSVWKVGRESVVLAKWRYAPARLSVPEIDKSPFSFVTDLPKENV